MRFGPATPPELAPVFSERAVRSRVGTGLALVAVVAAVAYGLRLSWSEPRAVLHPGLTAWISVTEVGLVVTSALWFGLAELGLLALAAILVVGATLVVPVGDVSVAAAVLLAGDVVVLAAVALQFSRRVLRATATVLMVLFMLVLAGIGRTVVRQDRLDRSREAASQLDLQLAAVARDAQEVVDTAAESVRRLTSPDAAALNLRTALERSDAADLALERVAGDKRPLSMLERASEKAFTGHLTTRDASPQTGSIAALAEAARSAVAEPTASRADDLDRAVAGSLDLALLSDVRAVQAAVASARMDADAAASSLDAARPVVVTDPAAATPAGATTTSTVAPALRKALDDVDKRLQLRPSRRAAQALAQGRVASLCSGAGGSFFPVGGDPRRVDACKRGPGRGTTFRDIDVRRARAALEVARARVAGAGRPTDAAVVADDEAALAAAEARGSRRGRPTDGLTLVARGGSELFQGLPLLGDARLPAAVPAGVWLLVAALGAGVYRKFERWSGSLGIGPVEINPIEGDTGKDLTAAFRTHVLSNVPEPGAVPGGVDDKSVTDLLESAASTLGPWFKPVVGALRGTVAPAVGYKLHATYHAPPADSTPVETIGTGARAAPVATAGVGGRHEMFVSILDAGTGSTRAVTLQTGDTAELAIRAAGYWAAGWIIDRSDVVPAWAKWTEETAGALAVYRDPLTPRTLDECKAARRQAPDSGLVLTMLGNAFDLEGAHREALACYLRACLLYPRFLAARYRLAVSLGLVASDLDGQWWKATETEREAIIDHLSRFAEEIGVAQRIVKALRRLGVPGPDDAEATMVLCSLAVAQLGGMLDLLTRRSRWWQACDRQERAFWFPLRWGAECERLTWVARSAALGLGARGGLGASPDELEAVCARAQKRETWWQVLYNLSCYYAIKGADAPGFDRDEALKWLERAASRPGTEQLTVEWVRRDPDLTSLRSSARFDRVVASLRHENEGGGDGDGAKPAAAHR